MMKLLIKVFTAVLLIGMTQSIMAGSRSMGGYDGDGDDASRGLELSVSPSPVALGNSIHFNCQGTGDWSGGLRYGKIWIYDSLEQVLVNGAYMNNQDGYLATYEYTIPENGNTGNWNWQCQLVDRYYNSETKDQDFQVVDGGDGDGGTNADHASITEYTGPETCIACHEQEAHDSLNSIHMQWSGPTTNLSNVSTENGIPSLGKADVGINTFCTYAPSSAGACYGCHIRADGNAGHAPEVNDVDCLMCHSDTYQRKFIPDTENPVTVTNVDGITRDYIFGLQDEVGNYTTVPDYNKMPEGTTMEGLAQNVHMPTRKSCLRCHAAAGGGDWTKRGDMGWSSVAPTEYEDVHMSPQGEDMSCTECHKTEDHKIGGRGIDLRADETAAPGCTDCHEQAPHSDGRLNRHAEGQVACQTCHISEFAKGGATEMSRDWLHPHYNPAFCAGQGGYVGHEIKQSNVKPEYRFFDGTSYVYNLGETITPNADGTYTMARANGSIFDGKSKIVPIKNHWTTTALHDDTQQIIAPEIMQMFMTGVFDNAVQKGMVNMGLSGSYSIVDANAEMLITHGVGPKDTALDCMECHDNTGETPDGSLQIPFTQLGYHSLPEDVKNCTLCHDRRPMMDGNRVGFERLHDIHMDGTSMGGMGGMDDNLSCQSCHTR